MVGEERESWASAIALLPSTQKRSPAVRAFELNPFRILRLDAYVSTTDAANQAENALTLSTVGMELPESDPLPWLPSAGSYDLQQAAQIEESDEHAASDAAAAAEAISGMPTAAGALAQTVIDEPGTTASTGAASGQRGADLNLRPACELVPR